MNTQEIVTIATKLIKPSEGCVLRAYPDPASPLGKALQAHGLWTGYLYHGKGIPEELEHLCGLPFTIGYGDTENVHEGMTITQEQADLMLQASITKRVAAITEAVPALALLSSDAIAACTSLAYNIGTHAFAESTVAHQITEGNLNVAYHAFALFNKARGVVEPALITRRATEAALFISVRE